MSNPTFLTLEEVLIIHESMIELYGGTHGIRDEGLLMSAIEMPKSGFGDSYLHDTIFHMASAYLFHLTKNHPFLDGNKRIGLGCADVFLALNGFNLEMTEDDAFELTIKVASENITKEEIAVILESQCSLTE